MVAQKLAQYIEDKGIKQKAIADAIGISPQALSSTLAGKRTLGADEYRDICRFLEVPYARFMDESPEQVA